MSLIVDFTRSFIKGLHKDLGVAFLVGALPVYLALEFGGGRAMESVIISLIADSNFVYYILACSLIFLVVAWLDFRLNFGSPTLERIHNYISEVLLDTVFTMAGLLYVMAGVIFAFSLLYSLDAFEVEGSFNTLRVFLFGFIALIEANIFKSLGHHARKNWLRLNT